MKERTGTVSISGIGYEGVTVDELVSRLKASSVDVLVDVRLNAVSRKRGFSKRALSEALTLAGIDYKHFRALGNARDNRSGYAELTTTSALEARETFRTTLESEAAQEQINDLVDLARDHRVAVFCFESDGRHCHREQVIEAVDQHFIRELTGA